MHILYANQLYMNQVNDRHLGQARVQVSVRCSPTHL